ncbi:unnamed protein product [Cercopithifilaria johnstoni]|uniref:Uncharacterized protein n=1 Tax=Cercopithifilaria johnstoni TaxID=2874296 RepID=A0A8J2MN90_9BILA|nr:unnamed protein product [Cercopithifilaria johnstoni]
MSNAQKKQYFAQHKTLSLSAPVRRKWYKKVLPMDFQGSTAEDLDLSMSTTSNQLIGALATWHNIHASLMKFDLSSSDVSSDKVMKAPLNSSSSTSSSYSTDSFISYGDSLSGDQTSNGSSDDEKLFNYQSRLSISNLELQSSQLKEMFPMASEHWRYF